MMQIHVNPEFSTWEALTTRNIPADDEIESRVREIVDTVRREGDVALRRYALNFDGVTLDALSLSDDERAAIASKVSPEVAEAIRHAAENIRRFHAAQTPAVVDVETQNGVRCVQKAVPIQRVGLYVPGGSAPLFSTVLMLAVPAQIAGCKEVILCTPEGKNGIAPEIVFTANLCGVHRIVRVGGAQAVAAMAYGTETLPRVDKIFGPGNRYVMKAKQLVSRDCSIDMPAGPSEVLVMADETARPDFVAADLLSQAEHGADSQAMLVCQTVDFAERVVEEVKRQAALLPRHAAVEGSLAHSHVIVLDTVDEQVAFANLYASEHLIIAMKNPWGVAEEITSAGSVFIGNHACESAGDYASGTNHTLPTSGWARSCSGVNLDSYMRKITYQELTEKGLRDLSKTIVTMAEAEGLAAHANAVKIRTNP